MILLKGQTHDRTKNYFKEKKPEKRGPGIRPVAEKREREHKLYESAKREWGKDKAICEVTEAGVRCASRASPHPHHKKGRVGRLLYAVEYFLAVCPRHHNLIHANPKWAYQVGYLIKRT